MNQDFMQKLMASKAIMDKHNNMPRGQNTVQSSNNTVQEFNVPSGKYNIPNEFLNESQPVRSTLPKNTSVDAIKNSKLPDEIKRLMIEHPIDKPQMQEPILSDELIEKASRLMKEQKNNNYQPEPTKQTEHKKSNVSEIDYQKIQSMINSAIKKAFSDNGMIVESTEKTNDFFSFKVGKHIFEGKITKIKKLS